MSKKTSYIIRIQAFVLALLVFMLSSGFTYHWQACSHANADSICVVVDQTCCCLETAQTATCPCSDLGYKSCKLNFSEYIQFNFETQLNNPIELQPKFSVDTKVPFRYSTRGRLFKNIIFSHNSPPPKSGREILHRYSLLVVWFCFYKPVKRKSVKHKLLWERISYYLPCYSRD